MSLVRLSALAGLAFSNCERSFAQESGGLRIAMTTACSVAREESMSNRPPTISIKEIASAVEKAVKIASEKHGVKFGPELTINPGLIMGRWLLEDIKVSQAELIAGEIAQSATAGFAGVGA